MKFGKIFKLFKKGSKAAASRSGRNEGSAFDWPSGIRVGVYGHANAGKTVYFTVLNEECKIGRDLQISVTDNATAGEFLTNFRSIWGLGTSNTVGTVVDLQSERKFPDPSQIEHILRFNAIVDGDHKLPIVAYDYPGAAVSIADPSDFKDKVIDFTVDADGLLFFFDSKILNAEMQTQAHVASFVHMLERLAPVGARLPIPIGLVITKSDILDGFTGDDQVVLVPPENDKLLTEDFDRFLERILALNHVQSNPAWAGSVRTVLVRLREFLKIVVGRTLDFQIFFTSNTGSQPEKIGTDVGRSIYKPPDRMSPIGVKQPFHWLVKAIMRNRAIGRMRKFARYAAVLASLWLVLFSLPYVFHFYYLMPNATNVEDTILESHGGDFLSTQDNERRRIISAYSKYERSSVVKWFFPTFMTPAGQIKAKYTDFDISESIKALDQVINRFTAQVSDSTLWPKLNPSDAALLMNNEHEKLVADLESYHQGDSAGTLFQRSDRILQYWTLFTAFIANRADSAALMALDEQVQFDERTYAAQRSKAEESLGRALSSSLAVRTEVRTRREEARQAAVELDDVIERINGNSAPDFRLGDAVTELTRLKRQLNSEVDAAGIRMINNYLNDARKWQSERRFKYKVVSIPGDGHMHLDVTAGDADPAWSDASQIIAGFEYSLNWKVGDNIHIALDTAGAPEQFGKTASDKKVLGGKYALFTMDGEITFDNLGQTITIQFSPPLIDRLPELKQ